MPAIRGKTCVTASQERTTRKTLVIPPRSRSPPSDVSASTSSVDGSVPSTSLLDPCESSNVSRSRKGPGHVPRPPNAFILFRQNLFQQLKSKAVERDQRLFSQIVSTTWRTLTQAQRDPWYKRAQDAKLLHEQKYPGYRFMPVVRTDKPRKRNVKRNGPKDRERCQELGRLIAKGSGTETLVLEAKRLDAALRAEDETSRVTRELGIPVSDQYSTAVFDATLCDAPTASSSSVPLPSTPKNTASRVGIPTYAECPPAGNAFCAPPVAPFPHIEPFASRLAAVEESLSTKGESQGMSSALYHMSPLKETPGPEQQPLFIPPSTPSTPSTPPLAMPATTLAPAFSMSELLEGVPGLIEDWTSPFYGPFDDGNTSAFSSPSSSSSAFSSPSSSPSAASSAPSTPPQQHFAPGLLSSPVFPSCAPASGFALPSSPVHFQMDANPFAIPDLGYPGEPMYSGDSMYPANSMYPQDALALSQMDGMNALMAMQGNGEEQGQEGMSILNTYFNGVGGYMG